MEPSLNKKDPNKFVFPATKPRKLPGGMPTRRERDRTKTIPREEKYKGQELG
jgi:hypothetical protein